MNCEECQARIERLEKLYEKTYHSYERLSIYIPKLTDILIRYWSVSNRWREFINSDAKFTRDLASKAWEKSLSEMRAKKKRGSY